MFAVLTPAPDRGLLTVAELRAASGVEGAAQDGPLLALGLRVADLMARDAGIAVDGVHPPTFRLETVEEAFRRPRGSTLVLARRFVSTVVSVTEGAVALTPAEYELHGAEGMLVRVGSAARRWAGPVVAVYAAGFAIVPEDLKHLAGLAVREFRSSEAKDPLLRSETLEGVGRWDWQLGGTGRGSGSALPPVVADGLAPYRSVDFA